MHDFASSHCPYCGESIELPVDGSAGDQHYIEDCPVCCKPMRVALQVDVNGDIVLVLRHEDDT